MALRGWVGKLIHPLKGIMKNIVIASIFIVPLLSLLNIPNSVVWYPQLLGLILIGCISVALCFWKINKFLSLFLIYLTFSYLFICGQEIRVLFCLFIGFMASSLILLINNFKDNTKIYYCIAAMAIIQATYVVFQSYGLDPFFHRLSGTGTDIVGFLGSRNQLGIYSAITGVILVSINPLLSIFAFLPIFLAKQNFAMMGLLSGLLTYSFFMWNKKVAIFLAILAVVLFVPWFKYAGKSNEAMMERVNLWKLTSNQLVSGTAVQLVDNGRTFKCNPFTGFGLGSFFGISPTTQFAFLPKKTGHLYEHAHNDLLEALFEFGYIGLGLILLCIFKIIYDFINAYHYLHPHNKNLVVTFSCLVAQAVCSLGIYVFHAPVSLFMFFITLGLFYSEVGNAKQSQIAKAS